ncbi:MAG: sigma-54 dependent transcriptional regulator [Planctomycetota bacterium]
MPTESPRILIVDDQSAVRDELAYALEFNGFRTTQAGDGKTALAQVADGDIDVMLLDIKLPGMDGLQVLDELRQGERADLPVIVISGHGDIETAVLAVRKGAYDFLPKPFDNDRVLVSVRNALHLRQLQHENTELRTQLSQDFKILGESPPIQALRQLIAKVAPTDAQVLITGENGTGKELVARQLHAQSRRTRNPFVAINCAAIPADLIESELFGHERGAFTGAVQARAGHFEAARGGTLFLDEIGELEAPAQAKLLRALQDKTVTRVGGRAPISVDVRLIAATNQDLEAMVQAKTFREDLYYRLHVVRVHVPALRERPGDVDLLAQHFVQQACRANGLPRRHLTKGALELLRTQEWPGNVRELKNLLEAAAIVADGESIDADDVRTMLSDRSASAHAKAGSNFFELGQLEDFRAATEREFIRLKLLENSGNIKRTAERIGIQRSNLYKKLERYGLK